MVECVTVLPASLTHAASQLTTNQTSDNYQIANGAALGITGTGAAARPAASQLVAALGLVFGLVVLAA